LPTVHTPARINPDIVRSYDLRGVVGQQLSPSDAHALGLAYATVAMARGKRRVAVCRDGRLSSAALECALIDGLLAGGLRVVRLGLGPTPQMYFCVWAAGLDGGVMVTGSHNPANQNGFKLLLGAEPVFGAPLKALVSTAPIVRDGGELEDLRIEGMRGADAYVRQLARLAEDAPDLHVVWDCGNGAVAAVIEQLVACLPGRHTLINASVDGRFPAHHPDPSMPDNLRQLQSAVLSQRADLGIAFDGDGDRIGVVDCAGCIVWPDQLLLLLSLQMLAARKGTPIVADVKSSRVLFDEVTRLGGCGVMAPSGYVIVRDVMLHHGAPIAGEMSGHIIYADCWHATDDALYVAIRLLLALGAHHCSMAEFRANLPRTSATPEIRLPCPESRKASTISEVAARLAATGARVDTTDGLRVTVENGWWLLRASGTEPKLTARCEAADAEGLETLRCELLSQLRQSGIQC
jgi:phosphomannomutase